MCLAGTWSDLDVLGTMMTRVCLCITCVYIGTTTMMMMTTGYDDYEIMI